MNPPTPPSPATDLLPLLHSIAAEAADLAVRALDDSSALGLRAKQPQDFVSRVDEAVEELVRGRLQAALPGAAVFGEEQGGTLSADGWVIDPIDGTANYLRGLPFWAISVGCFEQGQAQAGIVAMPLLGLTVAAQQGRGLWVNGRSQARQTVFPEVRVASVGDATDDGAEVQHCHARLRQAGWVVQAHRSTATSMALAAIGRLDGHVQPRVKVWDMAGALSPCLEAGLVVQHGPLTQVDNRVLVGTPGFAAALADTPWPWL
jgi:myo-inositol-1(or 4)-monophosphatase